MAIGYRAMVLASASAAGLFAVAGLAAPTSARAQDIQAGPQIEEVVVTARRREERLVDVPVAATALGTEALSRYQTTSITQLNNLVPMVSFDRTPTGSGASLALRGVSSSYSDAALEQAVSIEIDGMPLSRGRILNDGLFDIAGIEVLKGPQALFFGKNSPGGVVSIRSADPGSSFGGFGRVSYEFETKETAFEGAIGGPVNDVLGARLAIFASQDEGQLRNLAEPIVSTTTNQVGLVIPDEPEVLGHERRLGARITLVYTPNETFDATFKLFGSYYESDGLPLFSEVMACPGGRTNPVTRGMVDPYADCTLNGKTSQGRIPLELARTWPAYKGDSGYSRGLSYLPTLTLNYHGGVFDVTAVTGYYNLNFRNQGNADNTVYAALVSLSHDKNETISQEIRATTNFEGPINFMVGGYYEKVSRLYFLSGNTAAVTADPANGNRHTYDAWFYNDSNAQSVFAQATWAVTPTIELAGGARYTRENKKADLVNTYVHPQQTANFYPQGVHIYGDRTEENISPEATLSWRPRDNMTLYAAYKTGYLAGGFANPGGLNQRVTLGNTTYQPSEVDGFEVGFKSLLLENRLSADITAYDYDYVDVQLTSYDAPTNSFVTKNATSAKIRGVEVQARYRAAEPLTVHGSFAYNEATYGDFKTAQCYSGQTALLGCVASQQDLSGRPLSRAPKINWNVGLAYDLPQFDNGMLVSFTADMHHKSSYFVVVNLNPVGVQDAFTTFDAGVKLRPPGGEWELALLGTNLSNEWYATSGLDKPGGAGEVKASLGASRRVSVQVTRRF